MIGLTLILSATQPQIDCAEPGTQLAMTMCAQQDFDAADEALNRQWQQTAAVMKRNDRLPSANDGKAGYFESLLEAQRAWLKMRDAHCRLEGYDARGGSMEPMIVSACLERLTTTRTEQLRALTINQVSQEPKLGSE